MQSVPVSSADGLLGEPSLFRQDNAATYSSHVTLKFLEANDVDVLDLLAKSPELNVIE